jgi:pimeloyl-ACP methyl ester carboxylesterase
MNANSRAPTLLGLFFGLALLALSPTAMSQSPEAARPSTHPGSTTMVTSRDGTRIAFATQGKGPVVIVVGGALSDRAGGSELAKKLSSRFTVVTYDRRGRGDSGDTAPYAVAREIEDLEALIDDAGGSAHVVGFSSGASLALQAAAALGGKVTKLALYEAPYSDADGAAAEWRALAARIDALLAADRREDAITRFMAFVGAPKEAVAGMKASPAWPGMLAMAPTLAYDIDVLGDDRAVPVRVAAGIQAPTLVMDGSESLKPMPFMRATADTLAATIPNAERRIVEGQGHQASADAIAPILLEFFRD